MGRRNEDHGDRRMTRKFNRRIQKFDKSISDVKREYELLHPLQTGNTRNDIFTERNKHLKEKRIHKDDLVKDSSDSESEQEEDEDIKDVDEVLKSTAELLPRRINFVKSKKDKEKESHQSDEPFIEPMHQLYDREKLVKLLNWKQVNRIGCGLNNLGNTCFLNSALQCLMYVPLFNNYLQTRTPIHSKNFSPLDSLFDLIKKSKSSTHPISPSEIVRNLKTIGKHFRLGRQEDSQEFIINLIDKMENSILSKFKNKLDNKVKETNAVRQIFGGYFLSQVETASGYKSNTYDSFVDLSLNIQNVNSIKKAINNFSKPDILNKENKYKNPITDQYENAKKSITIYRAPLVLIVSLKRFSYDGRKINKFIQFDEILEIKDHSKVQKYYLTGIVVHLGSTRNSGHYISFVKGSNGAWYEMDDECVNQISLKKLLSQHAYILFYSKVVTDDELKQQETKEAKIKKQEKEDSNKKIENVLFYKSESKTDQSASPLKKESINVTPAKKEKKKKRKRSHEQEEEEKSSTPEKVPMNGGTNGSEEKSKKKRKKSAEESKIKRSEEDFDVNDLVNDRSETSWDNATVIPSPTNLFRKKSKPKKDTWDIVYDLGKRKKKKEKVDIEEWKKGGKEFQKAYETKNKSK
eukprot:gene5047-8643_t